MSDLLPCDSPDFRSEVKHLISGVDRLSGFLRGVLPAATDLVRRYTDVSGGLEELMAAVSRESEGVSDQKEACATVKLFLDVFHPYLHTWTALCESLTQSLVDHLHRQLDDSQTCSTLFSLFHDSLADLDSLRKETITFKRSYVTQK